MQFIGLEYVTSFNGQITAKDVQHIMELAKEADKERSDPEDKASDWILVKGKAVVTEEAAKVFSDEHIKLFGNESQTVGPEDAPMPQPEFFMTGW